MLTVKPDELRDLATLLERSGVPGVVMVTQAAFEIERLEAECFKLAAGVCEYRGGNEHGNPLCLKTNELI